MCGICGIFGHNDSLQNRTMFEALLHRGPDGNAVVDFPWGNLGFCRLDIFGSSGLNQPVKSQDGRTALVFNGEIYNFEELAKDRRVPAGVQNEAELILHLFLAYGKDAFSRLKGMFAIAILSSEKLILVRDPLGIKPLVFCFDGGKVLFASEIKSLLRVCSFTPEIDRSALAETAVFGFIKDLGKTMFRGIEQVLPGSCIEFGKGKMDIFRFYHLPLSFRDSNSRLSSETVETFDRLMRTSASSYFRHSKHKQAIYLSGGIDSTLIAYFLQSQSDKPLNTFTLFDTLELPDREHAALIAKELRTTHYEHQTDFTECLRVFRHYLFHYESIVTDGIFNVLGSLAFHILTEIISKNFKVAYCGEGADELFGGYYWAHTHPLGMGDRLRARAACICQGRTHVNEFINTKFPDDDSQIEAMRNNIFDLLNGPGLTNCHLWSVDRSSSAFSIEARPLFLNDDVRNWALSLPVECKVSASKETKLILKKYAEFLGNGVIQTVAQRKKLGMPAALSKSLGELIAFSETSFRERGSKEEQPHKEFDGFLFTDLEKFMFDEFFKLFIINRGKIPQL